MKSILCCAILILPVAQAAPRKISAKPADAAPPKARVVEVQPKKNKILASNGATSPVEKATAAQAEKNTIPKVVNARPVPSSRWRWFPKFQKSGKEDTTWGFIFKRPF